MMIESLTIRIAETADQQALVALQWRASLANPGDREALLAHPDAVELPLEHIEAGGVFVAERQGVAVGFAVVLSRADGQAELDGLFVEPVLWRSGVGRSLVQHCSAFARARCAGTLHVIGHPDAQRFYSACGFELVGEHQTRFGVGLAMKKTLRQP